MSALAAVFNRDGSPVEPNLLQRMLDARPERAPHGVRVVDEADVALGHGHFWLLPEEWGEEQPLQESATLLSADVRLDNREELGRLLGLTVAELSESSDAELLLLSHKRWGEQCLAHIVGDFAFALWDAEKRSLFCARDALGIRDLCYYLTEDLFVVASEISQLLIHPAIEPRINEYRVALFLSGRFDEQRETYYSDIYYLPAAQAMIVSADEVRQWRHWDIDEQVAVRYKEEAEYVDHYRSLLAEAVRCRLRSTGPIGFSLSGGLDSTSLAALAAPILAERDQERLRSFSYAFDELSSCDERRYIEPIVDRYQIKARYILCDGRWPLKNLPEWPVSRDFVLADPFAGLPAAVMEAAQEVGIRLLVTGYFGDSLAGGGLFWALDMLRNGRVGMLSKTIRKYSSRGLWRDNIFEKGVRQLVPPPISRTYRRLRPREQFVAAPGIDPDLVDRSNFLERRAQQLEPDGFTTPGIGHRFRALTANGFSPGLAATRHQYNQHGLELSVPYLDRRLVEFVLAVPAYILGRPGYMRMLQRRAMIDYLPESVWQRPERTSFKPLVIKGLRDKESETVRRILADPQIVKRQYVRQDWLQDRLQTAYEPSPEWLFVWRCISLELWLQRYWS